ncbi:uncharacterized protein Z519_10935 [Cladophialophora bantiana CBS 173.52]|uniref:Uncharacterized protein n=1 Tax=Cladophialophora bantiana (strain ATCC 10958 / CBS 173.52 / CDC B-1940 / NIH 8579) TaxID=1442370 RepID=A0A0D2EE03_CLAB1|nr:uncharacterized protein Z519_10935 [Cladophialophora bantiana CBS 173.52]KIW88366.1 hypothetical protein Z519_10935 [Cladophialophora bantiana CBS 173.52]
MSHYNPNWGPPKRSTTNDNAGERQPIYHANPIFPRDDGRSNDSSWIAQLIVPSVADSRPTVPVAPPRSDSTQTSKYSLGTSPSQRQLEGFSSSRKTGTLPASPPPETSPGRFWLERLSVRFQLENSTHIEQRNSKERAAGQRLPHRFWEIHASLLE